eukprot:CAMPEP_0119487468 /NCGR_PEP_ID=MMETSP1344-20130328/13549_1 /TAXON_ID=236787 /ORGANISM="Florenciella parvula, Strain CCMP2471" /LENGTH=145 /DNA_ID=CAMNT_0007522333 /DNA_START=68 /DNA_END=505 /DNA_ORIENTATION=+
MSGSSNAFANGSNQNCGNVITDRSTTRLHAPPGGQSSFSLGWGSESAPAPKQQPYRQKENTVNAPMSLGEQVARKQAAAPAPAPVQQPYAAPVQENTGLVFGAQRTNGSNAYANGANQNCGNVLTDRPTTRLHAPPGGKSSISFF